MANPKIHIEVTDSGFDIKLENWESVTNVMLERAHYAVVKKFQVSRAQKLGAVHKVKMDAERLAAEEQQKLLQQKELENALS